MYSGVRKCSTYDSIAGRGGCVIIAILIFDKKSKKRNSGFKIFVSCIFVIQIIMFVIIKWHITDNTIHSFLGLVEK